MKQFSLDEYLKNPTRPIVTRNGKNVRIICTNANMDRPIIGLVSSEKGEEIFNYYNNGMILKKYNSDQDLFFALEKKEIWIKISKNKKGHRVSSAIYNTENEAIEADLGRGYYGDIIKVELEK